MTNYQNQLLKLNPPSFEGIRKVANSELDGLPENYRNQLYDQLERGLALLDSHEKLCQYLKSYGRMHQAKLLEAYRQLPADLLSQPFDVIDWGCGQAMGTINLLDYLGEERRDLVKRVTLIEPSKMALDRGQLHVEAYGLKDAEVVCINSFFENIDPAQLKSDSGLPVIHIFSNILDVAQIDLKKLSKLVDSTVFSDHFLVCVGPLEPNNHRLDHFFDYFDDTLIKKLYEDQNSFFHYTRHGTVWTYKGKIYKLEYNEKGHLIPIEYYPPVQFLAAHELDMVRQSRRKLKLDLKGHLTHFEVAAPFDLGGSIYDDVHPVLAVLNNIITRGLPTRSSVFIEEAFERAFGMTKRSSYLGSIDFEAKDTSQKEVMLQLLATEELDASTLSAADKLALQTVLTPIAIARFQKVMIEALITGHLDMEKEKWHILVEEKDVPFARLAVTDFQQMFHHLTDFSREYELFKLPEITLTVISNDRFKDSPLHESEEVLTALPPAERTREFDMVVSLSMVTKMSETVENFSKYRCLNNCYFKVRTINQVRADRLMYTSSLITYKDLVSKDAQGNYQELEENLEHLNYFLQLLFRKEAFRPGQVPILDRALKNEAVIGLLPTGAGKSLTYQLATMLQPGITMVIDPLKSLMKDQHDGLIANGIDCVAYINSSLSAEEKKTNEAKLEGSQLLIVFLSPERLSIASFRERLRNMHDYNVYFSYGVIDEVHCVSEWGHDFRFSYLHLGRNLYNYVRAKEGEISLFGLTATASFDVLADVERELSGNGAFSLDADTIVRYENTNRLELQYKVERVPISFEPDGFFDKGGALAPGLPMAVNITNHWSAYDTKAAYLGSYYKQTPEYLNELNEPENVAYIKKEFVDRQQNDIGAEFDLVTEMPEDYYTGKSQYEQAGIVFCPHVRKTGVSVERNTSVLRSNGVEDVRSFSGQDDDQSAIESLEAFRENRSPLMVATKAFGMGIDKPNVRYTVNMNYSGSLEAFVQEAGRSGRDRKMALSTILLSDYNLASIRRDCPLTDFPLAMLKNKWFRSEDLETILTHYNLNIPEEYILRATPANDIAKLYCATDNKMFGFGKCNANCSGFKGCDLKKVKPETKGWKQESELLHDIREQKLNITRKHFQYLNPDYQAMMYFFNGAFKGDVVEKTYMHQLLNLSEVQVVDNKQLVFKKGFLESLSEAEADEEVMVFVPYTEENYADLSKAIYRMCCIELIEDFTQDYVKNQFRIIARRKSAGGYFKGLRNFLLRYYTADRADLEIEKVKSISLKAEESDEIKSEIYRCLAYLTEFVYDKISEKRKRALDDMRNFCIEGISHEGSWIEANEKLKDFIYYYFNSKYAKNDYIADNGEPFSLVVDTDEGKFSAPEVLFKYLRVIEDEIVGTGTPLDNVKHLYGAVRLISRSLTDSNPALALLEVFCLAYMGTKNNKNLEEQLYIKLREGMLESKKRSESPKAFWELFDTFTDTLANYIESTRFSELKEEIHFLVHLEETKRITEKYTEAYA
ncbi:DEAD/DEAH box helicase [Robertkochia sediminum]|uniref:DEAD/DEAH box helicase n=1 Tax=Robertkochia sediminum TaxID=2785326 RepID=UPI001931A779|nr:DEAD/DEAH box helicase [Robertkochia sediminum]MBL7471371.1 ATP-dependent DNA helicase RecQ [Robertkochia sediminum]